MWWLVVPALFLALVLGVLLVRYLHAVGQVTLLERARQSFPLERTRLQARFLEAAAASGKPRGLRWVACQWDDVVVFARDKPTGQILALVGVTIQFEAIPGSDMEGLPAVGNLRNATGLILFREGRWETQGKALFNLNPDEAITHFQHQFEKL